MSTQEHKSDKEFDLPVTDYTLIKHEQKAPDLTSYRTLIRLLVGAALEAGDELNRRANTWQETQGGEGTGDGIAPAAETGLDTVRYAAIGFLFGASETAVRSFSTASRWTSRAGKAAQPLARSQVLGPVRRRVQNVMGKVESRLDSYVVVGRQEETNARQLVRYLFSDSVESVVAHLGESPGVETLIDTQVNRILIELAENEEVDALIRIHADSYLSYLNSHPDGVQDLIRLQAGDYLAYIQQYPQQIDGLIRDLADRYIQYLQEENPEAIQDLVAGQSVGLAGEVINEARQRTVTADSFIEAVVRAILGRQPREELEPPPPEVQRRAAAAHLKGERFYRGSD